MGILTQRSVLSRPHLATTRLATQMINVSALMRIGELQRNSTQLLPLEMLPELCLNVTEMVLRIIQGVIWALGISPMATTGRVRSSTLNKGN